MVGARVHDANQNELNTNTACYFSHAESKPKKKKKTMMT
jgi:hypothetical protein